MALPNVTAADELGPMRTGPGVYPDNSRAHASAVSWGAIVAGASVAGGVAGTATTAAAGGAAAAGSEMAKSDSVSGPMGYFVDSLFRKDMKAAAAASAPA